MELKEYQARAAVTAQPAAYQHHYLVPMIVGEVGELFGQRAKAVWHGWDDNRLRQELVSEYGDIAWGTAILLRMEGVSVVDSMYAPRPPYGNPWQALVSSANDLHLFYSSAETTRWVSSEAQRLWLALQKHCQAITGHSWDTVLQANLAKLAGRVQRGTLVGQGDHR